MTTSRVQIPEKLGFLLEPRPPGEVRYKCAYGGRGAGRSWTFARSLLVLAAKSREFVLCTRELQKSIQESVHRTLSEQIELLGIPGYTVEKGKIYHSNGSQFVFSGLRDTKALKSYEGITKVWVEEAENVSDQSWEFIIPTVFRRPTSEMWVSWNPMLASDATHRRFAINPPPKCISVKTTYLDNPWCPQALVEEAEHMRETDPDSYRYVWLGDCRPAVKGAVYEREMATAESEGRLTTLRYDPAFPVHTYWDLGWNDTTTVWMVQFIAREARVIDYYQSNQQTIADDIQALQARGYVWGTDYLPWDADKSGLKAGKSIRQMAVSLGRKVAIVPQGDVHVGIQAVRMMFPRIWFDAAKCADGLQALRHYRYAEPGKSGTLKREPVHDDASHAADALRGLAMAATPAAKLPKPASPVDPYRQYGYTSSAGTGGGGWT